MVQQFEQLLLRGSNEHMHNKAAQPRQLHQEGYLSEQTLISFSMPVRQLEIKAIEQSNFSSMEKYYGFSKVTTTNQPDYIENQTAFLVGFQACNSNKDHPQPKTFQMLQMNLGLHFCTNRKSYVTDNRREVKIQCYITKKKRPQS